MNIFITFKYLVNNADILGNILLDESWKSRFGFKTLDPITPTLEYILFNFIKLDIALSNKKVSGFKVNIYSPLDLDIQ